MKHILLLLILVPFWSCKAQSPIKSLYNDYPGVTGAYYKDIDNDLDKFIGTWKYTSGTTSLTITLQKKIMQPFNDNNVHYYEDIIIGEYKYIENGVEKINTLSQLLTTKDPYEYNIVGNILIGQTNRKLRTSFSQPDREIQGMTQAMFFQRADSGSVQKLQLKFMATDGAYTVDGVPLPYTSYTVPFGDYLLVK